MPANPFRNNPRSRRADISTERIGLGTGVDGASALMALKAPEGHTILVVDDDSSVRWLLATAIQRKRIETDVAENGRQAIDLLKRKRCNYCCVLLDLNIPPPDGVEIAKYIRDSCGGLPVVVISGYPDLAKRIKNEDLGTVVNIILMKPVDTAFVVDYIHGGSRCLRIDGPQATPPPVLPPIKNSPES